MITAFAVSAALMMQTRDEMDGMQARRILEASRAADSWVFQQVHTRLVPDASIVTSSGRTHARLEAFQEACRRDLTNAAYEQICDAYHVSKKRFNAIVRNPGWASSFEFVPDANARRRLGRQLSPWERKGTLFDPGGVRLKESLAARYGYINPRKPEPEPPSLVLEQLIGPSPLPREFTESAVKPARKKGGLDDDLLVNGLGDTGLQGVRRMADRYKERRRSMSSPLD